MVRHALLFKRREQLRLFIEVEESEVEESEVELDHICQVEAETFEAIRRNEVEGVERGIRRRRAAAVRRERCFWKTDALRTTVIGKAQRLGRAAVLEQV